MFSQKTIVLRTFSPLYWAVSLLWLTVMIALVVLWQLPQLYLLWVVCLWGLTLLWRYLQRSPCIYVAPRQVSFGDASGQRRIMLAYQNHYWMVLRCFAYPNQSALSRILQGTVARHRILYRDQFSPEDYRYLRSRLSVMKFIGEPVQKNESGV